MTGQRVVVALGGNALLKRSEKQTTDVLLKNVAEAAISLADLASRVDALFITHGNGPQIGRLANQSLHFDPSGSETLDILGAETEGLIGYLIHQELMNALGDEAKIATLLTRVEVDAHDPDFKQPTKPIGPVMQYDKIKPLAEQHGWVTGPDGDGYRRLVASPEPKRIVDLPAIEHLGQANYIVICCGGGGIPVCRNKDGKYHGVEAVIDKDLSSSLLATELQATALLLLTDVAGVYSGWGSEQQHLETELRFATEDATNYKAGTMRPKLVAAEAFARATGGIAAIGSLAQARQVLSGKAGTRVISG